MNYLITFLYSYIFGSISSSYLLIKVFKKEDITSVGSKNAGATNTLRMYGKKMGILTLLFDALKCICALVITKRFFNDLLYFSLMCVIIGHIYSFILKFKGGKGIACAGAGLLYIDPKIGITMISIFVIVVIISRYVSLGSISVSILVNFIYMYVYGVSNIKSTIFLLISSLLILYKHRDNIIRILEKKENKLF